MSILEQKFQELGYELTNFCWQKRLKGRFIIQIHIFTNNDLVGGIIQEDNFIRYISQIKRLEHVFNVMQRDLEELRKFILRLGNLF